MNNFLTVSGRVLAYGMDIFIATSIVSLTSPSAGAEYATGETFFLWL